MKYFYLLGTVFFAVTGQILLKWKINSIGSIPNDFFKKIFFLMKLLLSPYVIFVFFLAFLSALCWMASLTKFDLSVAYPFMGLTFVFILLFSTLLLKESISFYKIVGLLFIVTGIILSSRG